MLWPLVADEPLAPKIDPLGFLMTAGAEIHNSRHAGPNSPTRTGQAESTPTDDEISPRRNTE